MPTSGTTAVLGLGALCGAPIADGGVKALRAQTRYAKTAATAFMRRGCTKSKNARVRDGRCFPPT